MIRYALKALVIAGFIGDATGGFAQQPLNFDPNYRLPSPTVALRNGAVACPTFMVRDIVNREGNNAEAVLRTFFERPNPYCIRGEWTVKVRLEFFVEGQKMATFKLRSPRGEADDEFSVFAEDIVR